jgi:hypothetical protein
MIRRVDFALGSAAVRLVSTFIYPRSRDGCCEGGRVYEVVDVRTGRGDVVGVEFLQRL